MVNNAHDQHRIAIQTIEYPVLTVNKATDAIAQFGVERRGQGKVAQQAEGFVKAMHVGFGNVVAKP